jgi:hypothetical protein
LCYQTSVLKIAHTIDQFEEINVNNNNLDSIELIDFESNGENLDILSKYQIKKLHACNNFSIIELNKNKPNLKHLTDLEFDDVDLEKLDKSTFECCASTLEKLSLTPKQYKYSYPSAAFKKLVNLKELEIQRGEFRDYKDGLRNLTKLTKLVIRGVKLTKDEKLRKDSFKWLVNLKSLDLTNYYYANTEPGTFNGLSSLTHLNLEHIALAALQEGTFQGLGNLEEFNLGLFLVIPECIDAKVFSGLGKLSRLSIKQSALTVLSESLFRGLISLEELNLSYSDRLKSIDANVFSDLRKLKKLNLSGCRIAFIDPDAFDDSQEIAFLNLKRNKLKRFVTKCSPRIIHLSDNARVDMIRFIGSDLSNIKEVDLLGSTTLLKDFNLMFHGLTNLETLKLDYD